MIEVTDATFEQEVTQSDVPVVIDFWAPWCGPCKTMGPLFETVSKEFENQAKFVKINVDNSHTVSAKFSIRAIPTIVLFKSGEPIDTLVGMQSKAKIAAWLMSNL